MRTKLATIRKTITPWNSVWLYIRESHACFLLLSLLLLLFYFFYFAIKLWNSERPFVTTEKRQTNAGDANCSSKEREPCT